MYLFTFRLSGWVEHHASYRGGPHPRPATERQVSASAPNEKDARLLANPYVSAWRQALRRSKRYAQRMPVEAAWYAQQALHHADAARYFNQALVLVERRQA